MGFDSDTESELIVLGHIAGAYGVRGWVRVYSETSPPDNIFRYKPWYIENRVRGGTGAGAEAVKDKEGQEWLATKLLAGRRQGKGLVAQIEACGDRDRAEQMRGVRIAVKVEQLPELDDGDFYWRDLLGLKVVNQQGIDLGRVSSLMETGSNDVLVVNGDRERLIPYLPGSSVVEVDSKAGRILVDWDADF